MIIAPIRKEDLLQVKKVQAVSYNFTSDLKVGENDFVPGLIIGAYDGDSDTERGTLFATMYLNSYKMAFDNHWVGACGVGGVATLPEYRHKHAIRRIFEYAFKNMEEKNQVFSLLYPFSHAYYNKFGYECGLKLTKIRFDFSCLNKFERNTRCRLAESRDDEQVKLLYTEFAAKHNCAFDRCFSGWKELPENPYRDCKYTYVYSNEAGVPSGYFVFYKGGDTFCITELVYRTPADLRGILGFIRVFDPNYRAVEVSKLPDDEDFTMAFTNYYDVSKSEYYHSMARVVNVEKALKLMRYPENKGAFSISVSDRTIAENSGIYDISFEHGLCTGIKKRTDGDCDVKVTERSLARLVLGTENILSTKLCYDEGLEIISNKDTLTSVFVKKSMFINDGF